jgi:hypothetical protein
MPKRERPSSNDKNKSTTPLTRKLDDLDDIFAVKKDVAAKKAQDDEAQVQKRKQLGGNHKKKKLTYTRQDTEALTEKEWADDGLGGKFNREGYTGRVEGGVKIYKAHLFNAPNFSSTKDCPFDCQCCVI